MHLCLEGSKHVFTLDLVGFGEIVQLDAVLTQKPKGRLTEPHSQRVDSCLAFEGSSNTKDKRPV